MKKYISLWKNLPASAKSSIAFVFSTFFLKGISFLTTPIFTRIMDPSQYGVITNYSSWLSIIEVFALLGLTSAGVLNVGLNDYRASRDKYLSSLLGLSNIATVISFGLIALLKLPFGSDFILPNNLLVIMFVHLLISPAQIFWMTKQRYEFKYKASTVVTIGSVVMSQLISILFVLNAKSNLGNVKLLATEIGALLFSLPIYILLLKKGRRYVDFSIWKTVLIFALPLIPHYLAQHVMSSSDKILLKEMVGEADAGIFGVVANVGSIAVLFWTAINASLVPITFDSINRNDYTKLKKMISLILTGYGFICLSVILIAPEVLIFLAPEEYRGGMYAIPPLVGVSFLNALYNVYANVEFYYKKSTQIARATVIATVANLVLNLLLIPIGSYIGSAYATLISNILLILMHYMGYRKCHNRIYNDRYILALSVVIIAFALISNVLYSLPVLRFLLLGAILLTGLLNIKKILGIVKSILKNKA